jgi:hypothetical protein
MAISEEFFESLKASLDSGAAQEFRLIEQGILRQQMEYLGWEQYPDVIGNPAGERESGECLCECGKTFFEHPFDWRVIGYGNVPFLNILCDGRRVKL